MSYSRWSHCDVYTYPDMSGGVTCMAWKGVGDAPMTRDGVEIARLHSEDAMRAHLAKHRAAGHDVPDGLEDAIAANMTEDEWQEVKP